MEPEVSELKEEVRELVERLDRVCDELESRPPRPKAATPGAKSVLVVEDNDDSRQILVCVLEHAGYAVIQAKDGREALAKLEEAVPSAVLLDVRMPRMDGIALSERLRANPKLRGVPVIAVSAIADHASVRKALRADAYFQKPVDLESLLETLPRLV